MVQLHEDAAIRLVEVEGAFHEGHGFGAVVLLVEGRQGQVAPDRGEQGIDVGRHLPQAARDTQKSSKQK